jgi:hypothetical protein
MRALTAEGRLSAYILTALPVVVAVAMRFINPTSLRPARVRRRPADVGHRLRPAGGRMVLDEDAQPDRVLMNASLLLGAAAVLGSLPRPVVGGDRSNGRPSRRRSQRCPPAGRVDLRAATLQRDLGERPVVPLVARLAGLARRYNPRAGASPGSSSGCCWPGRPAPGPWSGSWRSRPSSPSPPGPWPCCACWWPRAHRVLLALGLGAFGFFPPRHPAPHQDRQPPAGHPAGAGRHRRSAHDRRPGRPRPRRRHRPRGRSRAKDRWPPSSPA